MTLSEALLYSTTRAIAIATLAFIPANALLPLIERLRSSVVRSAIIVCALLPLFVPELLVGFTYRLTATRLVNSSLATEALYALILLGRAVAVVTAVRLILPATAASRESLHAWKLLNRQAPGWTFGYARLLVTGPYRPHIIGWCISTLMCFQEFETAALVQIDRHPVAWSVWLFDAHAQGESLSSSLSMLKCPLLIELLILIPVLTLARIPQQLTTLDTAESRRTSPAGSAMGICWLFAALVGFAVWPVIANGPQLIDGITILPVQTSLLQRSLQQIGSSLGFALISALVTLWMAVALNRFTQRGLTIAMLLPGLSGSLVLSLSLLAMFQTQSLNHLYDTPLPMILGLSLLMLPRAFLLVLLLMVTSSPQSRHSATLLLSFNDSTTRATGQMLLWRMVDMRWLLATGLLLHWCFWDVTVPSVLRPLRFEPVVTRLYGEMHYGRTETLAAITCLSLLAPLMTFVVAAVGWNLVRRCFR